jgi:hypothetical protein
MPARKREPLSETIEVDGRRLKMSQAHYDRLGEDVAGPKRFYTQAWLDDYLERFSVVAECPDCSEPLIAEEADSHGFKHIAPSVRPVLRMYLGLNEDDRAAVRDYVAAHPEP